MFNNNNNNNEGLFKYSLHAAKLNYELLHRLLQLLYSYTVYKNIYVYEDISTLLTYSIFTSYKF